MNVDSQAQSHTEQDPEVAMMDELVADPIGDSYELLKEHGSAITARFYELLFQRYPEVKPLFEGVAPNTQADKLWQAIELLVAHRADAKGLEKLLTALGQRHSGYGALPDHYPAVADTLLQVLAEFAGPDWNDVFATAWQHTLTQVAETMISAHPEKETEMNKPLTAAEAYEGNADQVRLQAAVDGSATAMMHINRDFEITYFNAATESLIQNNLAVFQAQFPGQDFSNLQGFCIDAFHKKPAHQRQMLSDPANLPFQTTIEIGPLSFELNVTAIVDAQGSYLGNALEWSDVTAAKASELEVTRLMSAVQGITTAIMMVDRDFNVTYANPATVDLLNSNLGELRQIYPGLNPNELVGSNIDMFHKNPHHQRQLLSDPANLPHRANIKVGPLQFSLVISAITGSDGEYIGATLEWSDITQQKDGERQIEGLITAASKGDLEQRVDTSAYSGFMQNLGEGINHLLDAVVQPVRGAKQVIAALAEGNLCEQMDGAYDGEFAELRDSLNGSIANLTDMVSRINESADSINSAASEIAQGNSDLSKRTEDQASSLEETAASLEEITSTVKQNAENARQANQAAIGAREQATKGGDVVSAAINAMQEVSSSSKKVADIIGVIDEIAFQTNLLALNAAVEAARAGEQGRGFAVVATEVRNLAQRSATAAKEIKSLIQESGEKVQEGSELVNESGKTLEEIVGSVKEVVDIIAEIAAASNEQALGIEQINQAVGQMDQMTQQNAALVEQSAAASESMEQQAAEMSSMMEFFTLPAGAASAAVSTVSQTNAPQSQKRVERSRPSSRVSSVPPRPRGDHADEDEWSEF